MKALRFVLVVALVATTTFLAAAPAAAQTGCVHTVRAGDTASAIASAYGLTPTALKGANPSVQNWNFITIGQKINICPRVMMSAASVGAIEAAQARVLRNCTRYTSFLGSRICVTWTYGGSMVIDPPD